MVKENKEKSNRKALITEYKVLNTAMRSRNSYALLLDSIMIPSSLLLVWYSVVHRGDLGIANIVDLPLAGFLSLLTISLIIVSGFYHITSNRINDVCYSRIEEIEENLKIEGNTYVYKKIRNSWWFKVRENMWIFLFFFLAIVYSFISYWNFVTPLPLS